MESRSHLSKLENRVSAENEKNFRNKLPNSPLLLPFLRASELRPRYLRVHYYSS